MITSIEGQEEIDEIGSPVGATMVGESQRIVHDGLGVEGGIKRKRNVDASSRWPARIRVSCVHTLS